MSKNKWIIDPAHSEIQFKVKHLMITTVTGYFRKFTLEAITEDEDFSTLQDVTFTLETASVDTNNNDRDNHLRSSDFFDSGMYSLIEFKGTKYKHAGNDGKLTGHIIIRGISKPITLDIEFGGIVVDPNGQTKAGFTVNGKLNRKDFGLTWGAITEAGNVVVGDEVKIHGELQLIKQ